MRRFSISTWSLHRALGRANYQPDGAGRLVNASQEVARLSLLDLPVEIARHEIRTMEVCHFHVPRTDAEYIASFRAAVDRAGVELFSILIDTGDITHPDAEHRERDLRTIRGWIDFAAACGASRARVSAGDAEATPETVALSARNLRDLARYGRERRVQVITENWRRMTRRPGPVLEILDRCEGEVGLCADYGNFAGPTQLDDLAQILPRAGSVHAKAERRADGSTDRDAFRRCMQLSRDAGFDGPYSLIFSDAGDEWQNLDALREDVRPYL